ERRRLATEKKTRFVHYSSAEAAVKLITNREVWMCKARCMNDFSEIDYGMRCLRDAVFSPEGNHLQTTIDGLFPGFVHEVAQAFDGWRPSIRFAFNGSGTTTTQNGGTILWTNPNNTGTVGPLQTVPFLNGTTTHTPVVTGLTSTPNTFLTNGTNVTAPTANNFLTLTPGTTAPTFANAATGVTLLPGTATSPNAVVNSLNVTS